MKRFWLSLSISIFIIPSLALATNYYVRTDGSDSCSGLSNSGGSSGSCAYRTIQKAAQVASCGDTVHIGAGLFVERKFDIAGDTCATNNRVVFRGQGPGVSHWVAPAAKVNSSSCTTTSYPNVYRCSKPSPPSGTSLLTNNSRTCFMQKNSNHVRFLDANGTKGDMSGPVCLTWNTISVQSVSDNEGYVYEDGSYFYIHPWDNISPSSTSFFAPITGASSESYAEGAVQLDSSGVSLEDLSILSAGYVSLGAQGDNAKLENVDIYGGWVWLGPSADGVNIKDVQVLNAYRRPAASSSGQISPTAWGNTNSQSFSIQGSNFTIENLHSYAAREGVGFSGASNGTVNGLKAHGHHNHILKFIDSGGTSPHDIVLRDIWTYNGQEPLFVACGYNLSFENSTFPFSHIVIQGIPDSYNPPDCASPIRNLDFRNNVLCGIHFFNQYDPSWSNGDHDLDNNLYLSDYGACNQNSWNVGANGQKFSLNSWKSWSGDTCPNCTRDPNSQSDRVANTWVSYDHKNDTLPKTYDFDLKTGSKAINLGNAAFGDDYDIEGQRRQGAPDAGAYEGGEESGDTMPPKKPTNLRKTS